MQESRLSRPEFIAMMALLFATVAFSIDAMLPALPEIGRELAPANLNHAQFVVLVFVAAMGIGTLVVGPLSDSFGRKPVILGGAVLFMLLTSIQQIFDIHFGRGDSFPLWFALIAVIAGSASFTNAMLVGRLGMRFLVRVTLSAQLALSVAMAALFWSGILPPGAEFAAFMLWAITLFGMLGLTIGNLNALAMEPLGHVAGMAASIIGALATVMSALLAVPVGQAFDGTPRPLATGVLLAVAAAFLLIRKFPERPAT